jgi:hypothetical protein
MRNRGGPCAHLCFCSCHASIVKCPLAWTSPDEVTRRVSARRWDLHGFLRRMCGFHPGISIITTNSAEAAPMQRWFSDSGRPQDRLAQVLLGIIMLALLACSCAPSSGLSGSEAASPFSPVPVATNPSAPAKVFSSTQTMIPTATAISVTVPLVSITKLPTHTLVMPTDCGCH